MGPLELRASKSLRFYGKFRCFSDCCPTKRNAVLSIIPVTLSGQIKRFDRLLDIVDVDVVVVVGDGRFC